MKICLLNHGLASGGTDSFVLTLATGLVQDGHDVTIAMAVNPESKPQFREDEAKSLGIKIHKLSDLGGIGEMLRYARRLYWFLKTERFDVFHANMDLFNGINMFVAWMAKVPVRVCHSHTINSQYEQQSGKHFAVNVYRKIMRHMLWKYSTIRCGCSEQAMNYLYCNRWVSDKNSHVIYNGIDMTVFCNKNPVSNRNDKKVITVGRITAVKNPFFIVKIMNALCALDSEYSLDWVGNGELKDEIEEEIRRCGIEDKITLLGAQKNIPDLLHQASIFLFPSIFEGLPIALIEAQATGLSCVVSDRVSHEADVGKCSFLSIDDTPESWAEKIIELRDDKSEINYDKLRKFVAKYMVKQVEKTYSLGL